MTAWMAAGMIGIFAGIMVMILGSVTVGVAVLVAGMVAFVTGTAKMLRAYGYQGDGAFWNGWGQGRQQSELVENPQPGSGEQSADIWNMVEKK